MITIDRTTDPRVLRTAFSCFPTGVAALCAEVDGELIGMAASSFTCVSLDPALVSVCIQNESRTWSRLAQARRLGVSVLGADQGAIVRTISSREGDRFAGTEPMLLDGGAVVLRGAPLWLECSLWNTMQIGDHLLAVFEVHGADAEPDRDPLVFHASAFRVLEGRV
ncbi:flavin reductase family protein [Glaciibacter sp. 2TAF33]|uniref:flavin reductase family protein n=1 Tax=Glaciibacter sp. 2TAF33 TaxID=3233015 RepID=UPI003F8E33F4